MKFPMLLILTILIIMPLCKGGYYKVTDQVFFDVAQQGKYLGKIIIGLFGEDVPRTVNNFKTIAASGVNGKTYENSIFHRVVERFMIQGGDILYNNGTGSISIYGRFFEDENFKIKHAAPGIISMANGGPNTNGCQFFITTMSRPWLDGNHTAFGKVIKGQDLIHIIEHMKTDSEYRPLKDVVIIRSGILKLKSAYYESDEPYEITLWAWIKAGWIPLSFSFLVLGFFHFLMLQLNNLKSFQ